jgi:hypothetical protein
MNGSPGIRNWDRYFTAFMTTQSKMHNTAIPDAYDFSGICKIVDVGGGHGTTLGAILRRYPTTKGILFDLPEVVAAAQLDAPELAGRCEVVGGSTCFFQFRLAVTCT